MEDSMTGRGVRITDHQLEMLARRWRLGSDEAVADSFGISRSTVRNTLREVRLILDATDTMQCTWLLRDELAARERRARLHVTERTRTTHLRKSHALAGSKGGG
jgi:DNA-binding CsgD family transcriptional regulator